RTGPLLTREPLDDLPAGLLERTALRAPALDHLEDVEAVRRRDHVGDRVESQLEAGVEHLGETSAARDVAEVAAVLPLRGDGRLAGDVGERLRVALKLLPELRRLLPGRHHDLADAHALRLLELRGVLGVI